MMIDTVWNEASLTSRHLYESGCVANPLDGIIPDVNTDDIDCMIDDLGLFQDNGDDDAFSLHNGNDCDLSNQNPSTPDLSDSLPQVKHPASPNPIDPQAVTSGPILTIDTGAVAEIPDHVTSSGGTNPSLPSKWQPSTVLKACNIGLAKPPVLLSSHNQDILQKNPVAAISQSSASTISIESVIEQQRKTILRNQQIIDAQQSKINHNQPPFSTSPVPSPIDTQGIYSLSNEEQPVPSTSACISVGSNTSVSSNGDAYKKWKLSPVGATKLRSLDSASSVASSNASKSVDDAADHNKRPISDISLVNGNLTPIELEVRRERNRKHAQKSRLRKKSLTSTLEQSLELLRQENAKLRVCIEEQISRKKTKFAVVDDLLEQHRSRSHERFIQCIISGSNGSVKSKKGKGKKSTKPKDAISAPVGKGIIVDEKVLKLLKGMAKAIPSDTIATSTQ